MKRIIILMVMLLVIPALVWGQAMPKKVTSLKEISGPSDGFVTGGEKSSMVLTEYMQTSNILIGPGYAEDGFSMLIGYAKPLSMKTYLIGTGKLGKLNENDEVDLTLRGYYLLTSGITAFNAGLIVGMGPLWERIAAEEATVEDWIAYFSGTAGFGLSYSFGRFGLYAGYEYQIAGDFDKTIHRAAGGLNILM